MAQAATVRVERAPRREPQVRPRGRPRPQAQRRVALAGSVLWIVVLAALLAGVVALNVAVLQLNLRLDRLTRERADLRATNAALAAELSTAAAAPQIQQLARERLGLVAAAPEDTAYVDLAPRP